MEMIEWTRSETLALAKHSCTQCHGLGLRAGRGGQATPCNCVFRAIFRACYNRFQFCATKEKHMSRITLERTGGPKGRILWGRKDEEYVADFCLVSHRTLDEEEYRIFKFHYLLGADWRLCCRQLKIDRGNFFHMLYRIEQKLGRTFRELRPYSLFPLDEYFHGTTRQEPLEPTQPPARMLRFPVRPIRMAQEAPAALAA
jgi:hypothetical protein